MWHRLQKQIVGTVDCHARPGEWCDVLVCAATQAPGAGEARADNLVLHGLAVQLGPDLRVLYPMNVLNFGIAGELVATGPADPARLKLAGTIRCVPLRILSS